MATLPLCSIIVTCYNYENFVADALDSVSKQTYRPLECIIVNDASTDHSLEIIERKVQELNVQSNGINYFICNQKKNGGQLKSIQEGLKIAKGTFISSLDADDILFPDFIAAHIHAHMQLPVALTFNEPVEINKEGELLSFSTIASKCHEALHVAYPIVPYTDFTVLQNKITANDFQKSFECDKGNYYLFHSSQIPSYGRWLWYPMSAVVMRAAAIRAVLNITNHDQWRISADWLLLALAHLQGGSCWIPQRVSAYRRHGGNSILKDELKGYYPQLQQHKKKNIDDSLDRLPIALITCLKDTADPNGNNFYLGYINAILYEAGPKYMWKHRRELREIIPIFRNFRTFYFTLAKCILRHRQYRTPAEIPRFIL